MKGTRWSLSSEPVKCLLAVLTGAATMVVLLLVGRDVLDRAIIALCCLVPVGWSAVSGGPWPCTCATLAAMLAGELFFIPPLDEFTAGKLAAWLLLAILLVGANVLASRMQDHLARDQDRVYQEYHAVFVHGLSAALAGLRTQEAVIYVLARHLQELFQAALVEVHIQPGLSLPMVAKAPLDSRPHGMPNRVLPIRVAPDLVGEIRLWSAGGWLPPTDSYLFRSFAAQAALALERVRLPEPGLRASAPVSVSGNALVTGSAE